MVGCLVERGQALALLGSRLRGLISMPIRKYIRTKVRSPRSDRNHELERMKARPVQVSDSGARPSLDDVRLSLRGNHPSSGRSAG